MSGLAEASDANYYYVKDVETLPNIFAKELGSMMNIAARKIRDDDTLWRRRGRKRRGPWLARADRSRLVSGVSHVLLHFG